VAEEFTSEFVHEVGTLDNLAAFQRGDTILRFVTIMHILLYDVCSQDDILNGQTAPECDVKAFAMLQQVFSDGSLADLGTAGTIALIQRILHNPVRFFFDQRDHILIPFGGDSSGSENQVGPVSVWYNYQSLFSQSFAIRFYNESFDAEQHTIF
jgi:hypothetical protein